MTEKSQPARRPRRLKAKPRPATDREERTLALRSAILESAIEEFATKSYAGASLRAIAAKTGIELGHLGYHFSTKLELWQAAVSAIFESFPDIRSMDPPANAAEAAMNMTRVVAGYASFALSHPEHIQIVFSEAPAGGERLAWIADNFLDGIVADVSRQLEAAQRFGVLAAVPVSIFFSAMVGVSAINFALPHLRDIFSGQAMTIEELLVTLARLIPRPEA
ncbi:TetR/AcrR family transcriptional regulator [Oleomonas cavernae]|uniref:TetR/AcrR family transcriptional regulator n=1 Tax=Oleomonas cavernae TaxID=2320859 RepID=A0A418WCL8_9PROT|nr:TetR/AcrR family transcriptional regulator [Oleomonas cavernae]RJF87719.1 TetR/AcrR family transcriptional regulator [Oleomonas cavernae]